MLKVALSLTMPHEARSMYDLWISMANYTMAGHYCAPRGLPSRELIGARFVLTNPTARVATLPIRKFSLAYACGELAWYASADDSLNFMQYYAPQYERFSDNGKTLHGAYGPRIFAPTPYNAAEDWTLSPWDRCVRLLRKDPDSRQAVIPIYQSDRDLPTENGTAISKDVPCTLSLQFLLRDEKLWLVVNMRSQDFWLGVPYDFFCFTALQELMACELGVGLGHYVHLVGSLHAYEPNWRGIERVLERWHRQPLDYTLVRLPWLCAPNGIGSVDRLLKVESFCRTAEPLSLIEGLLLDSIESYSDNVWPLLDAAAAAWAWKRLQGSALTEEGGRRVTAEIMRDKLGLLFERCFF